MEPVDDHPYTPARRFDGGDLDCGNGLLLLIRQNLDLLEPGELLEILSNEVSVEEDLPAWCRLTNNDLLSWTRAGKQRSYLICRGSFDKTRVASKGQAAPEITTTKMSTSTTGASQPGSASAGSLNASNSLAKTGSGLANAAIIPPLSVMGIGSWPRPAWLMPYLHKHLEGRISDEEFNAVADDAVRLAVQAQTEAGVSVITDGEQRRDNYASFVGQRLAGCQLIPVSDLLPLVDDPDKFKEELKSLDVPADKVRHPAVMGKLSRKGNITGTELQFLSSISRLPIKIAIPGPYLLSRLMWMECITDKVYASRQELAQAIVKVLQEEIADLLAAGASLIQLDEPVLSEIVFTGAKNTRSFMCGALSERGTSTEELSFATELINATCAGFPQERLAMHVCRGNWTPDENAALSGSYEPLLPVFNAITVGTLFLEYCTPRAGDISVLKGLRRNVRIGLGVVNQKSREVETVESIMQKANACIELIGAERLLLNPDCGFATFADNPVSSAQTAERKLAAVAQAAQLLKQEHGLPVGSC